MHLTAIRSGNDSPDFPLPHPEHSGKVQGANQQRGLLPSPPWAKLPLLLGKHKTSQSEEQKETATKPKRHVYEYDCICTYDMYDKLRLYLHWYILSQYTYPLLVRSSPAQVPPAKRHPNAVPSVPKLGELIPSSQVGFQPQ